MFVICRETPDQPAVTSLFDQADARTAGLYPGQDRAGLSAGQLIAEDVRFFVVRRNVDSLAVACGGYIPQPLGQGPFLSSRHDAPVSVVEIKRLFVNGDMRRQGLARMLMVHMEQDALANGFGGICLETGIQSDAAIALYASLGYQRCAPFGPYQRDVNSVFMVKMPVFPLRQDNKAVAPK
ncbi:GNAT family N-acetyltransferase [Thalassospira sp. TSL5-1]|uniref:GNAT family N-acetyltransferase n=1 Tax=Thalassospira sp. TSL5-1 TaxID=1544451 RepID=UPI0009404E84|nr:GNAT family N-acetyltransferase [Thalassospira sp. TSL5-1]